MTPAEVTARNAELRATGRFDILDEWILSTLARPVVMTAETLAGELRMPRPLVIASLVKLAELELIVEGSPDVADEGAMDSASTRSADRVDG